MEVIGIFKKNEIKSAKRAPQLYTYEPPFQKSWIRPCIPTRYAGSFCDVLFSLKLFILRINSTSFSVSFALVLVDLPRDVMGWFCDKSL